MNEQYSLKDSAVVMHEMYISLRGAGFTKLESIVFIVEYTRERREL